MDTGNNLVLGLDMGANSLGWSLVKEDNQGKPCGIHYFELKPLVHHF
jgi:CRISPR/Cas system Type II protein with McrA/HNH and RuvC-like nuclease domain